MNSLYVNVNGPYHTGMVRWNGSMRQLEVMDQSGGWHNLMIDIHQISPLPHDVSELLTWARDQKIRQTRLKKLREKYPTLDQALIHAEVIEALVQDEPDAHAPSMVP